LSISTSTLLQYNGLKQILSFQKAINFKKIF